MNLKLPTSSASKVLLYKTAASLGEPVCLVVGPLELALPPSVSALGVPLPEWMEAGICPDAWCELGYGLGYGKTLLIDGRSGLMQIGAVHMGTDMCGRFMGRLASCTRISRQLPVTERSHTRNVAWGVGRVGLVKGVIVRLPKKRYSVSLDVVISESDRGVRQHGGSLLFRARFAVHGRLRLLLPMTCKIHASRQGNLLMANSNPPKPSH